MLFICNISVSIKAIALQLYTCFCDHNISLLTKIYYSDIEFSGILTFFRLRNSWLSFYVQMLYISYISNSIKAIAFKLCTCFNDHNNSLLIKIQFSGIEFSGFLTLYGLRNSWLSFYVQMYFCNISISTTAVAWKLYTCFFDHNISPQKKIHYSDI